MQPGIPFHGAGSRLGACTAYPANQCPHRANRISLSPPITTYLSPFSEWLQQILPAHADRHATVGSKELLARQEAANGNHAGPSRGG
jgi:hypothetical protein